MHPHADLVKLHESTAALLASRGDWQQAYRHIRSALDLLHDSKAGPQEQAPIPEQLRHEVDRLRREHAEAHEQSIRDSLTASYNRRYLDQRLTNILSESYSTSGSVGVGDGVAVALIDLDWFKQVNDTFGHLVGDQVLQRVVELLCDGLPDEAFCARYGGEEFVLVLPGIDSQTAIAVSESARAQVERYPWSAIAPGLHVTISVGVAHEPMHAPERDHVDAELQLLRADGLLYTAKQSGRNAVAYRMGNRVELAGGASGRRMVTQPRAFDTF
ncbi:MAG: GGDEF domain-containing protein [Sciscionella sp.]